MSKILKKVKRKNKLPWDWGMFFGFATIITFFLLLAAALIYYKYVR